MIGTWKCQVAKQHHIREVGDVCAEKDVKVKVLHGNVELNLNKLCKLLVALFKEDYSCAQIMLNGNQYVWSFWLDLFKKT